MAELQKPQEILEDDNQEKYISPDEVVALLREVEQAEQQPTTMKEDFADLCYTRALRLLACAYIEASQLLFPKSHEAYIEIDNTESAANFHTPHYSDIENIGYSLNVSKIIKKHKI